MGVTVIAGAGGRLGSALAREWKAAGENVIALDRHSLPLGDPAVLKRTLSALDFDVLVNCAALTNVDYCEGNRDEAFRINGEAPAALAVLCEQKGARCIHISTDYVFDGLANRPYRESDAANPVSVYGASKLAGEQAVVSVGERHWSVRVSWVFGPDRPSFVDQIVTRAVKEDRVDAVADKWATPTYTLDAGQLLRPFLRQIEGGGIIHLSNAGLCSWQEYGQWALDCAHEAGVALKAKTVGALAMADLKAFIAKRPPYTAMDTSKIAGLTGCEPRSWKDAVRDHIFAQAKLGVWG
ncbi:MAG: dTDP-4-dehydrorhamnose reductase [Verrucomicrobiota bacterium]